MKIQTTSEILSNATHQNAKLVICYQTALFSNQVEEVTYGFLTALDLGANTARAFWWLDMTARLFSEKVC